MNSAILGAERLPTWPDSRLAMTPAALWLMDHGGMAMPMPELFDGFCSRLVDEGLQLLRVTTGLPSMHPQTLTRGFTWQRGKGVAMAERPHGIQNTAEYLNSPIAVIHQGAAAVRRRLDAPDAPMDFGILPELKALGVTDYLALPMRFTQGPSMGGRGMNTSFISFATDRAGGFRPDELSYLMELMPLVALRMELEASRRMTRDLLNTYLGHGPAKRVLQGNFLRGRGYEVEAAIWLSDLRGFTAFSDRNTAQDVVATLDSYFDAMAAPIQAHDGEILKFIGDGLLAIFRIDDQAGRARSDACRRALAAARESFAGLHELNQGRALEGAPPLRVGLGLHLGKVMFGNIGASDRLDFTVIGRAVNEVARLEAQTKVLDRPILASATFAAEMQDEPMEALGFHGLRGVKEPQELFTLPKETLAGYE